MIVMAKSKIKYKWKVFLYIMLLASVMLFLSSIIVYINVKDRVKRQSIDAGHNMMIQLKNATDLLLKGVDQSLMQILFDFNTIHFVDNFNETNYVSRQDTYDRISAITDSNCYFRSIYVYYFKENQTLDPFFGLRNGTAFNNVHIVEDAVNAFKKAGKATLLWNDGGVNENLLTFVEPMPYFSKNPKCLLVASISKSYLDDMMKSITIDNNDLILITDKQGNIITQRSNWALPYMQEIKDKVLTNRKSKVDDNVVINIDGKGYFTNVVASDDFNWKYIYLTPYAEIQSKIDIVKNYVFASAFICLLFGIIISLILSEKLYIPVKLLQNRNTDLEGIVKDSMPILKNNFIQSLLKGEIEREESLMDKLEYYGIDLFFPGYYMVCSIVQDNYGEVDSKYEGKLLSLNKIHQDEIIHDVISENKNIKSEIIHVSMGVTVLILSLRKYDEIIDRNGIVEILEEIKTSIKTGTGNSVSISAGGIYQTLLDILHSYNESVRAIGYRLIKGPDSVILFEEIGSDAKGSVIDYPYDIERDLLIDAGKGDREAVTGHLREFTEKVRRLYSCNTVKFQYLRLYDGIVRYFNEMGINAMTAVDCDMNEKIMIAETINNLFTVMDHFLSELHDFIELKKSGLKDEVIGQVNEYILKNYSNPDISIVSIAEKVHFSSAYLCKRFKDVTGKSVKEQIISLRIGKACKYLTATNMPVTRISEAVGYTNEKAFIKIFKKYTGMTPTEFRSRDALNEMKVVTAI